MSDVESRRSLVTGATGYIGGHLAALLVERGQNVRAMARTPEKLRDVPWRDEVEVVRGDLGDPDSLVAAFDGVDVVYYLVHSMGSSKDFVREEENSARNVAAAAEKAGVRRIVYLSGLHPTGELSRHLRSRNAVGEILMASSVETVVLQAGIVVGSGSASFEMIRHLTDRLPVMTTPKWVRNKIQPISIDDVLHYLVEAADAPIEKSRTFDIGCPDVLEYADAMQVYAEEAGLRRRFIVALPLLTPSIASWWVGLVTPIPSGLARPLVESLEHDAVMSEHDIDAVIPPPPGGLTGFRESVVRALKQDGATGKGRRHLIRFSSVAPQ
ncbi:NAD(P)H-binding protein [Mycobacterium sp. AT1]|uniref:NAD(P)H-binding protein n=1 Tax=Mycobacterium sp. AT1 TaxID=1961706 RepID=UPI0009AEB4CB|nr:NAD(P)H-binding protein [Mycobacterium sp. AT1]OPX09214.1 oxidoreductase [Mycobacterium sp. AT1]